MNDTLSSMGKLLTYFDTGIVSLSGDEKSMDEVLSFLPEELKNQVSHDVQEAFDALQSYAESKSK